jgi:hypothetical protein
MRSTLGFVLVSSLAIGCSHNTGGGGGGGGGGGPDAPGPGGTPAFEILTKDVTLQPGEQITYCYYTHTSNTTTAIVNKWVSDMTPGSHHAIVFTGGANQMPDGTIDSSGNCGPGAGNGTNQPVWTYSSQVPHQEADLPSDDGTGKPLGQNIAANTAVQIQLHYLNGTDQVLTAHFDLKAYALAAGTPYTQTDAYVTYNQDISIGSGATGVVASASCTLPTGVKFWSMGTHSHKQSVQVQITDGSSVVLTTTDWEHPMNMVVPKAPFYTFTAPKLSWACTYNNNAAPPYCDKGGPAATCSNADTTVMSGPSAVTNEMCMAVGYFFPSTGPKFNVQYNGNCFSL